MKNTTYTITNDIKKDLATYKKILEQRDRTNNYNINTESTKIPNKQVPQSQGHINISMSKEIPINKNKNEIHYFKLTYLIHATTFQFQKSFCFFARNKDEAIKEGALKAFSQCRCKMEDIHLRKIKEVSIPETFSSQLTQEHRRK